MKPREWIISETPDWVAVNKPPGIFSIPGREGKEKSLKEILQENYERVFTVHRLDKDTSGIIIFARNEAAHQLLSMEFEKRQAEKFYLGFVTGSLLPVKSIISAPLMEHPVKKGTMVVNPKGKESVTEYEVLENFGVSSWVQFKLITGRTHQIRVHMKYAGHPLLCDSLYGDDRPFFLSSIKSKFKLSKNLEKEKPLMNRLALHAYRLKFTDKNSEPVELEAPLPRDIAALLHQLRKWKGKNISTP